MTRTTTINRSNEEAPPARGAFSVLCAWLRGAVPLPPYPLPEHLPQGALMEEIETTVETRAVSSNLGIFIAVSFQRFIVYSPCWPSTLQRQHSEIDSSMSARSYKTNRCMSARMLRYWPPRQFLVIMGTEDDAISITFSANCMLRFVAYRSNISKRCTRLDFDRNQTVFRLRSEPTHRGCRSFPASNKCH